MAGANSSLADAALGFLTVHALRAIRLFDVDTMSNMAGGLVRKVGPLLPEHKIGRDNLTAAFPEKSPQEIEKILASVWDNLGRVGAEFAHIDRLWDYEEKRGEGRIMPSPEAEQIALRLRESGKPVIVFAAHLANWELAAVAAAKYGLEATVLYRRPNLKAVSQAVIDLRAGCMGTLIPTTIEAPMRMLEVLQGGGRVAMLVDQWYGTGVPVTFFGRPTRANPLIAWLARKVDCPIHGIRIVRHPGNRFQVRVTEAIEVVRDAKGRVDLQGTMQAVTSVIESWVREHPEQWLWVHRRWRDM